MVSAGVAELMLEDRCKRRSAPKKPNVHSFMMRSWHLKLLLIVRCRLRARQGHRRNCSRLVWSVWPSWLPLQAPGSHMQVLLVGMGSPEMSSLPVPVWEVNVRWPAARGFGTTAPFSKPPQWRLESETRFIQLSVHRQNRRALKRRSTPHAIGGSAELQQSYVRVLPGFHPDQDHGL